MASDSLDAFSLLICGGAVTSWFSALASESSGPGLIPNWGHCVVSLGKEHYTLTVPLSTQVYKN